MIAVDTNVLVRVVVRDDEDQFQRARALRTRVASSRRVHEHFGLGLADALETDATEPIPGPTFGVRYGQDPDFVFPNEEDERVREAGQQGTSDLDGRVHVSKPREGTGVPSDERESGLHLVQELGSQTLLPGFVPEDRLGELVRHLRREPDMGHFRVRETRSSIRVRVSSQVSPGSPAMAA